MPFAVAGQHHDVAGFRGAGLRGGVELLEVRRRGRGEGFHLAFAHGLPAASFDRVGGGVERAPGGLDRRDKAQPVAVALGGQVQHAVGGVQVRLAALAVGEALHAHHPEYRRQPPAVARLDTVAGHPGGVDNLDASLAFGAAVQVVLEHLAQQVPAPTVELTLDLAVPHRSRPVAVEPTNDALERRPRPVERFGCHDRAVGHRRRPLRRARRFAMPASAAASKSARAAW